MSKLISISRHQLVAFFSILTLSNGQVPFEYAAGGQNLIETGTRSYTVWNKAIAYIHCSVYPTKASVDIKILKNGTEVDGYTEEDIYFKESKFSTEETIEDNYTCRITFDSVVSTDVDKYNLLYILDLNLQISRVERASFCATSTGESGFEGEEVNLICNGNNNWWVPERESEIDIRLSSDEKVEEYTCRNKNNNRFVCNLSNFQIFPSLEVQMMPTVLTRESSVSAFSCNSTPPRLLYWRVWGENGDILDLDNYGSSLKVDTNITITQTAGETSLLISEAVPGGNGIYAVECFTYQKHTKAVIVRVAQEDGESCSNIGSIITVVFLVVVIFILAILLFLIYFKIKKDGLQKDDVKPVEPQRIPTFHNNVAYVSSDIQMTGNGGNDQDYTYIDQK